MSLTAFWHDLPADSRDRSTVRTNLSRHDLKRVVRRCEDSSTGISEYLHTPVDVGVHTPVDQKVMATTEPAWVTRLSSNKAVRASYNTTVEELCRSGVVYESQVPHECIVCATRAEVFLAEAEKKKIAQEKHRLTILGDTKGLEELAAREEALWHARVFHPQTDVDESKAWKERRKRFPYKLPSDRADVVEKLAVNYRDPTLCRQMLEERRAQRQEKVKRAVDKLCDGPALVVVKTSRPR